MEQLSDRFRLNSLKTKQKMLQAEIRQNAWIDFYFKKTKLNLLISLFKVQVRKHFLKRLIRLQ